MTLGLLTSSADAAAEAWVRIGLVHFSVDDFASALRAFESAQPIAADLSMTAQDIAGDEHLRARGAVTTLCHPEHGERVTVGSPWRFRHGDATFRQWSPALGEHNRDVFCGLLGVADDQFELLVRDEVIF